MDACVRVRAPACVCVGVVSTRAYPKLVERAQAIAEKATSGLVKPAYQAIVDTEVEEHVRAPRSWLR